MDKIILTRLYSLKSELLFSCSKIKICEELAMIKKFCLLKNLCDFSIDKIFIIANS